MSIFQPLEVVDRGSLTQPEVVENLKGPRGKGHFQFCQFENLIYMKLYSLLILTKNTKKSKNNFEAPKKSK